MASACSDRLVGGSGTPPDQLGDDMIELVVRKAQDGVVRVQLREIDAVNDQTINIGAVTIAPPPGTDQILLRLTHSTTDVGALHASFDYLSGGLVVGSVSLAQIGRIFGTETPGFTGDDENWTIAQMFAYAPAITDTTLAGTYGSLTIGQGGAWTYALANSQINVQNLAQGQTAIDTFTVEVVDEFGANDTETISITVNGQNDAPIIIGGPVFGAVQEDGVPQANGTLAATDIDDGATRTWTVVGGTTPQFADYHVQIDNFHVDRNGIAFFEDPFGDNNPPPSAPPIFNGNPTSYSVGPATLTEAGGRAGMDGPNGGPFAINTGMGHFISLNTNTSNAPADLGLGLKIDDDFTVEGRFDLTFPGSGENYGIRVSDSSGPTHPGDDVIQLLVLPGGPFGGLSLGMSRLDFVHSTVTGISGLGISPLPGDDQIVLRLSHQASNPGVIVASYELLDNGVVTSSGGLAASARFSARERRAIYPTTSCTRARCSWPVKRFSRFLP